MQTKNYIRNCGMPVLDLWLIFQELVIWCYIFLKDILSRDETAEQAQRQQDGSFAKHLTTGSGSGSHQRGRQQGQGDIAKVKETKKTDVTWCSGSSIELNKNKIQNPDSRVPKLNMNPKIHGTHNLPNLSNQREQDTSNKESNLPNPNNNSNKESNLPNPSNNSNKENNFPNPSNQREQVTSNKDITSSDHNSNMIQKPDSRDPEIYKHLTNHGIYNQQIPNNQRVLITINNKQSDDKRETPVYKINETKKKMQRDDLSRHGVERRKIFDPG